MLHNEIPPTYNFVHLDKLYNFKSISSKIYLLQLAGSSDPSAQSAKQTRNVFLSIERKQNPFSLPRWPSQRQAYSKQIQLYFSINRFIFSTYIGYTCCSTTKLISSTIRWCCTTAIRFVFHWWTI